MATKTITKENTTFYTITVTASVSSETATTATITWESNITFGSEGDWIQWGVGLKTYVNGSLVKDATGACTSVGQTVCSHSGTVTINKTGSAQSISFSATSYSATVNGYGGVTSSYVGTASGTVTVKATTGVVYIDSGSELEAYLPYIDNGTSWDLYVPYIDNGSSWDVMIP